MPAKGFKKDIKRVDTFRLRLTDDERDLLRRCARHSTMQEEPNLSEFFRHLLICYAAEHNIPVKAGITPALTVEQMGIKPGPAPFVSADRSVLHEGIDPDKFDDVDLSAYPPFEPEEI